MHARDIVAESVWEGVPHLDGDQSLDDECLDATKQLRHVDAIVLLPSRRPWTKGAMRGGEEGPRGRCGTVCCFCACNAWGGVRVGRGAHKAAFER